MIYYPREVKRKWSEPLRSRSALLTHASLVPLHGPSGAYDMGIRDFLLSFLIIIFFTGRTVRAQGTTLTNEEDIILSLSPSNQPLSAVRRIEGLC